MANNTQLPVEVLEELEAAAQDKYTKMAENAENIKDDAYAQGYAEGWHTGAIEYATKLHEAEQDHEETRQSFKRQLNNRLAALQAKCERYEQGLKDLKAYSIHCLKHLASPDHEVIIKHVDEALSGEVEKESTKQWWEATELPKYVKHKHGWIDEHIGMNQAGDCLVFIGRNDTIEWQFSFLQPATKEQYDAYINQKEDQ